MTDASMLKRIQISAVWRVSVDFFFFFSRTQLEARDEMCFRKITIISRLVYTREVTCKPTLT